MRLKNFIKARVETVARIQPSLTDSKYIESSIIPDELNEFARFRR
jgi:hypothetical protein